MRPDPFRNISYYEYDKYTSKDFVDYIIQSGRTFVTNSDGFESEEFPRSLRDKLFYNTNITNTPEALAEFCRVSRHNKDTYDIAHNLTRLKKYYEHYYIFFGCNVCLEYNFEKLQNLHPERNMCNICNDKYILENSKKDKSPTHSVINTSMYPVMLIECAPCAGFKDSEVATAISTYIQDLIITSEQIVHKMMKIKQNIYTMFGENNLLNLTLAVYGDCGNIVQTNESRSDGSGVSGKSEGKGECKREFKSESSKSDGNGGNTNERESKFQKLSNEKVYDYNKEKEYCGGGYKNDDDVNNSVKSVKSVKSVTNVNDDNDNDIDETHPICIQLMSRMKSLKHWIISRENATIRIKKSKMFTSNHKYDEYLDVTLKYYGYRDKTLVIPDEYKDMYIVYKDPNMS